MPSKDAKLSDFTAQIGQLFGDAKAAEAQLAVLKDKAAPIERRRQILTAFARDAPCRRAARSAVDAR